MILVLTFYVDFLDEFLVVIEITISFITIIRSLT
jgi:hypothetical protein